LREGGGGNLLFTLLPKIDHSVLMIFKSGDRDGQGNVKVRLHAPQTETENFWLCVWANGHLEKLHHF